MSTARTLRRTEKLDLRLTSTAKKTLEAAASALRSTVSAFVLDSALSRADEALADRRTFMLSKAKWAEFLTALDAPVRPLPRTQRLLTEPGFFDAPGSDSSTAPATATARR
jgi:uncharacterized protein (DUF1778 family)